MTTQADRPSPDKLTEQRYLETLGRLVDDAYENRTAHVLADSLAWTLAKIAASYPDLLVAGDILRRFGGYLHDLTDYRIAQDEAAQEKDDGAPVH